MAATPWLLLLCLAAAGGGVLQAARAQPDSKGFISIDCGLQGETGYVENATKLAYAPDNGEFTDGAGTCHNISAEYITPTMGRPWYNVRSFAAGARNCYTLRSLVPGLKYLVRARFMYGNYDGLSQPPVFDLHVGVNYWYTVNISAIDTAKFVETIVVVPDDFLQVCLINTGSGTPYISGLDLRPLQKTIYPQVTKEQGIVLIARLNFGPDDENKAIRDLSGNQLSGSIPSGLLKRVQDGSLDLRYENNPELCTNSNSCQLTKRKSNMAMYIAIPTVVMVAIAAVALLLCFIRRRKQGSMNNSVKPQNEMITSYTSGNDACGENSLRLENRRFTYEELKMITNNFQKVLGQGGFGKVYKGFLEDAANKVRVRIRGKLA